MIQAIVGLYLAFAGLIILHELVRAPEKTTISWKSILPTFESVLPKNSFAPLLVDVALITIVLVSKTTFVSLQYLGLVAWIHFLIYLIIGTLVYTKDQKRKIFPKIGEYDAWISIPLAIIVFIITKTYFVELANAILT